MADEPDDVLDLDESDIVSDQEDDAGLDEQHEGEADAEETVVGFGDVEAAPAPEAESSVIRDMRRANRELAKENQRLKRENAPKPIEVGERPTLAACEYDEDRFDAALEDWMTRKSASDRQQRDAQEQERKTQDEWRQRAAAYEADKAKLPLPDYADAEEAVFDVLSDQHKALLMLTDKPAALIYALHRDPAKLNELSKLDPARAAIMIGGLKETVTVTKRRLPQPDQALKGNAPTGASSQQRQLARLEAEAAKTGDRSKVANFKAQMKRA